MFSETAQVICPSCGYPSHAGHAPHCDKKISTAEIPQESQMEEEPVTKPAIHDVFKYFNTTRDAVVGKLFEKMKSKHQDLPIPDEQIFGEANTCVETYLTSVEHARELITQQHAHCIAHGVERGYFEQAPAFDILIGDNDLFEVIDTGPDFHPVTGYFDPQRRTLVVDSSPTYTLIAHETGHAISFNPEVGRAGFLTVEDEKVTGGWQLFDEGATTIWERNSRLVDTPEERNMYTWAADDVIPVLLELSNQTEDDLLRAYFHKGDATEQFMARIESLLPCQFTDLAALELFYNPKEKGDTRDLIRSALTGRPAALSYALRNPSSEQNQKRLKILQTYFPNIDTSIAQATSSQ